MSLIFGINLPRQIYLVSDSRLTSSDGSYKDDFSKWLDLNPRLAVVVANSAYQASWLLKKINGDIRPTRGWEWDFTDLEKYLKGNLKAYATEFYTETGLYGDSVSMIFGGFEKSKKLVLESGRLGEVMADPVQRAGQGVLVNQTVDMDIINAFREALLEPASRLGQEVPAGTHFEVDIPRPRVLAVTIRATQQGAEVIYEDANCYDGIVFNPEFRTKRVELPTDLIGLLEYRDKSMNTTEQTLYQDNGYIVLYVNNLIKERGWDTVGGNILPLLITPDGTGFATGEHIRKGDDGIEIHGGLTEIDGLPHYYDETGNIHPYRFVYGYADEKDSKTAKAKI